MAERGLKRRTDTSLGRDPEYDRLSLADLRLVRQVLVDEVEKVTYWRLVIRSKAERSRAGRATAARLPELRGALADAGRSQARVAAAPGVAAETERLPDLVELYARDVEPGDTLSTARLAADLVDAEEALTRYRSHLQARADDVTQQLIVRYREAPALALLLLPPLTESPWGEVTELRDHHRPFEPLSGTGDRIRIR
jgi:hypothetical protein